MSAGAAPPGVLLVDDDVVDVMHVQRAFEKAGVQSPLRVARDGIEALESLRARAADLVLLDLNLPRMNGLELLRALRGDPALRGTPVVVLTTSDDERDRHAASQLGIDGYLVKPPAHAELVAVVRRYS